MTRSGRALLVFAVSATLASGIAAYRGRPPRNASASHSVAGVFQRPPTSVSGYRWTLAGQPVAIESVSAYAGSDGHCGWQSATLLSVDLGDGATPHQQAQFVRDPYGVISPQNAARMQRRAALPADATDTGYRTRGVELWLARDQQVAYLVNGAWRADVESWPRNPIPTGCD